MKTLNITIMALIAAATQANAQDKKTIVEEIVINGTTEEVWSVIADNEAWEDWNPFILKSQGKLEVGSKIRNTMLMDGKEYVFKPKVRSYEAEKEFSWIGRSILPGIFDGEHGFKIERIDDHTTRLIQIERFSGILSSWFMKKHAEATAKNFANMNQALKQKVEQ